MISLEPDDLNPDESGELDRKAGAKEVTFNHETNTGKVSFDAPTHIDPDDDDVWMWILRDFFGEYADSYEVVEGTVGIGMHEGYFVEHDVAVKTEKGWEKQRMSGIAQMRRYSAKIRRRAGSLPRLVRKDLDEAIASAKKAATTRRKYHETNLLVVNIADLQLGKTQKGMGTKENLERIYSRMEQAAEWAAELKPRRIALVNPGDLVEACDGFYPTQTYEVDLNNREQMRLAVQIVADHLAALSPHCEELVFATAPSNHGEYRTGTAKTVTDPARDNRDLLVGDMIAELAPHRWPHLEIALPHETGGDPYLASFQTSDGPDARRIGVIHGHQVRGSGGAPIIKLAQWWAQNFMSDFNRPRGAEGVYPEECHVMIAGHFHHMGYHCGKSRILITAPASDLGSEWFETSTGIANPAGLLCFTVDEQHPNLVDQMRVFAS
ncbi:MAG: hypothetical protein KJN71_09365 [Acidimicrobiia bacterium]|nr:hypothetical protein [Acidimicrobiia bacterium]